MTREDPENALVGVGLPVRGSVVTEIDADWQDVGACARDWKAMTATGLGAIRTDSAGQTQTPIIAPGRYWLVGIAPY